MSKEQQEERICADRAQIVVKFILEALKKYNMINSTLPNQIVVYRDGVGGPSYKEKVERFEIPAVEKSLSDF